MRTAFVTGATGFIGRHIVEELVADGWQVVALCRPAADVRALRQLRVEIVQGDVCDVRSLQRAIPARTDAVFHVAGVLSLWPLRRREQWRVNVEGTRHMVEAALTAKARRLIVTSSFAAWGVGFGRITEGSPSRAAQASIHYCRTKWQAEEVVRSGMGRGLDAVLLNPAYTIGRYDLHGWARTLRLVARGRMPIAPRGRGTFCHAREVARAHVAAAERGRSGENYLLGGVDATFRELLTVAAQVVGARPPLLTAPELVFHTAATLAGAVARVTGREPDLTPDVARLVCSDMTCVSSKADRELGLGHPSLETMIADCHGWMVEQGLA